MAKIVQWNRDRYAALDCPHKDFIAVGWQLKLREDCGVTPAAAEVPQPPPPPPAVARNSNCPEGGCPGDGPPHVVPPPGAVTPEPVYQDHMQRAGCSTQADHPCPTGAITLNREPVLVAGPSGLQPVGQVVPGGVYGTRQYFFDPTDVVEYAENGRVYKVMFKDHHMLRFPNQNPDPTVVIHPDGTVTRLGGSSSLGPVDGDGLDYFLWKLPNGENLIVARNDPKVMPPFNQRPLDIPPQLQGPDPDQLLASFQNNWQASHQRPQQNQADGMQPPPDQQQQQQ